MQNLFWKNKVVLITGHTGVKGTWLCLWLQKLGATLIGLSLHPPSTPSFYPLTSLPQTLPHSYTTDIKNFYDVQQIILRHKPEIIFHLAASPIVRQAYLTPYETFSTNILGTLNLCEIIRTLDPKDRPKVFLNITSDKCYQIKSPESEKALTEDSPLGGDDPYGTSKAISDLLTQSYSKAFFTTGTALASLRAGNVIGGGDWGKDRLIPDFIRSLEGHKQAPMLLRNPHSIRPWQHILDALWAYIKLAEIFYQAPTTSPISYNIVPPTSHYKSVLEVVEELGHLFNLPSPFYALESALQTRPYETPKLFLSGEKLAPLLQEKYYPWSLSKTLSQTALWYQAYFKGDDVESFTLSQIKEYEKSEMPSFVGERK